MMQFLLVAVNAKYIHSNPAIYSLRAYAGEQYRPYIQLAEYTINQKPEEILADLYQRKPEVIGFSCYIWNFEMIRRLLQELPKVLPKTELWLGGPEVSFHGEELLKEIPSVKGIMAGEGEATFQELLQYYVEKRESHKDPENPEEHTGTEEGLKKIDGLILQSGKTGQRAPLDLPALPFLYEHLEEFQNKIIYYESSRGCPFRCSYCLSSIDKKIRLRPMEAVKKELQFFLERKASQVKFIDRTFNCSREHSLEIWRYIRDHDNGITNFHFEIAAHLLQEEEIALLSQLRPGLVQLEIGIQSANEKTLREINRFADISRIREAVSRLNENHNIHIHLDLIAGLPYEDYDSFAESFQQVYSMEPQQLQLGFLKVLKGTSMEERAEEYGLVYEGRPPYEVLYTNWISYGELLKLKRIEEMVELYYNSSQFTHILPVLLQNFDHAFQMYEALADYYEREGLFLQTPARGYRYRALLSFACETDGERAALYRELLTFDFYLREKAKSRPDFAADLSAYHETIWNFYREEEKSPDYLTGYQNYHAKQMLKMTHIDVFYYKVWEKEPEKAVQRKEQPVFILFDYSVRNPLTQDAKIFTLERL